MNYYTIESLLGKTKKEIETMCAGSIVSVNNVNSTIEVSNVMGYFDNNPHNTLFFFNLLNRDVMTMAMVKYENIKLTTRFKMMFRCPLVVASYFSRVTLLTRKQAIVSYVKGSIWNFA